MIDFQKSYQRTDFISFLKDFLPEETDFTQKDIVKENYWKFIQKVDIIGENKFLGIKILEVEQRSENDPRISITKEIFKLMPDNRIKKALVVFKNPKTQSYRLSLVTVGYELSEDGKIVKSVSDAKRYSFLCGVGEKVKTVRDNLIKKGAVKDFSDLLERFNVEVVRKEFFNNYLDLYVRLYREIIKDENFTKLLKSQGVDIVSFAKTLLGKLVFLYFIQKKGWLGVSRGGEYGKDGDKDFMRSIWDDFKNNKESLSIEKKGYFYNDYLEWLFYEGLNRDRRDSEDYFVNLQMKVPYLNGGLFKEDYKDWEKGTSKISNEIFSNKTEKYEGDGILDIFDTYNFTIDEDDLYDREVAVDPEMLGKIFEKMISISFENIDTILEEYNKNESSGKKKKLEIDNVLNKKLGAFYTPREIVHYMTKESLIAYLVNNLKGKKEEKKENEAKIRRLFELKEQFLVTKIEITESTFDMLASCITEIDELLKKVKVLDPAVGSGAFPMGLLHEIATIRYYIYGVFYETFKSPHPNPLPEGEGIEQFFTEKDTGKKAVSMYKIKRDVIQNNIYGVDISAGAIEIARLRFWLSLVVDEETPEPLPNFEFKFVCANTLVPLAGEKGIYDSIDEEKLREKVNKWYSSQTNKGDEGKEKLKKSIEDIIKIGHSNIFASEKEKQLTTFNPFANKVNSEFFDFNLMFGIRRGEKFDIVIGNPPYIKEYDNRNAFDGLRDKPYYIGKMDLWYYFACYGLDLLKDGGVESFIAQNNWITSFGAKIMRNKILEDAKIKEFIDFGDFKVFETAGIQTMIYILEKTKINSKYEVKYSRIENKDFDRRNIDKFLYDTKDSKDYKKHYSKIEKSKYLGKTFDFVDDTKDSILEKIYNNGNFRLTEKEVIQGIVGAPDDYYLVDKLSNFSLEEKENIKRFYSNVGKFCSGVSNKNIIYIKDNELDLKNIYPNIFKHFEGNIDFLSQNRINLGTPTKKYFNLHRERDEKFFKNGEKIVCGTRVSCPSFYYTEDEYYGSRALNFIKTDRINLKYLTALLNSNLSFFWLKNKGKLLGNLLQVDKSHLLNIPIRQISPEAQKPFIEKVDKILEITKQAFYDPKNPPKEQKDLEKEIDKMVYELYGLNDEEVRVVEENLK